MKLQDIIKAWKVKNHYTVDDMATILGVNRGTVSRWCTGEVTSLRSETAERLSEVLGFDIKTSLNEESKKLYRPIVGTVKAGYGLDAEELIEGYEEVSIGDYNRGDFFLRVSGDSMINLRICDGDLVYVKKCDEVDDGDIAIVMVGDEATIKRIHYKNEMLILEAANPNIAPRFFTKEEVESIPVRIIGKVLYVKIPLGTNDVWTLQTR